MLYFAFLIERVLTGLIVTGCMAPIIRECVRYSRQRETFGRPIGDNQYVQGHIVEAYTQLELLRGVLFRALSALERGMIVPGWPPSSSWWPRKRCMMPALRR